MSDTITGVRDGTAVTAREPAAGRPGKSAISEFSAGMQVGAAITRPLAERGRSED